MGPISPIGPILSPHYQTKQQNSWLDFGLDGCCNQFQSNLQHSIYVGAISKMSLEELVYDWNVVEPSFAAPNQHICFDAETLRDALQSTSVCDTPFVHNIKLLHL